MAQKEFLKIMESNLIIMDRLLGRLKRDPMQVMGYPRQQVSILLRLHLAGPAKLKDIAHREFITTPNLCAAFRKLERDGLVLRRIDDKDRRNTWYSVSAAGERVAVRALSEMRATIEKFFSSLSRSDATDLTNAQKIINRILTKLEIANA